MIPRQCATDSRPQHLGRSQGHRIAIDLIGWPSRTGSDHQRRMFLRGIENTVIQHWIIFVRIDPDLESDLEIWREPMDQADLQWFSIGILDQ